MGVKQYSAATLNRLLTHIYKDESKASKLRYGNPPGRVVEVSFDQQKWDAEIRKEELQVEAVKRAGTGCGKIFPLGWAGNSPVRCGAPLTHIGGQTETMKCHECL